MEINLATGWAQTINKPVNGTSFQNIGRWTMEGRRFKLIERWTTNCSCCNIKKSTPLFMLNVLLLQYGIKMFSETYFSFKFLPEHVYMNSCYS